MPEFASRYEEEPAVEDSFTWQNPETGEYCEVYLMSDGTQRVASLEEQFREI